MNINLLKPRTNKQVSNISHYRSLTKTQNRITIARRLSLDSRRDVCVEL